MNKDYFITFKDDGLSKFNMDGTKIGESISIKTQKKTEYHFERCGGYIIINGERILDINNWSFVDLKNPN